MVVLHKLRGKLLTSSRGLSDLYAGHLNKVGFIKQFTAEEASLCRCFFAISFLFMKKVQSPRSLVWCICNWPSFIYSFVNYDQSILMVI